jgi:hypothetical protein
MTSLVIFGPSADQSVWCGFTIHIGYLAGCFSAGKIWPGLCVSWGGRELQPDDEPRLISKIMTALETNKIDNPERLKKRVEKERLENIRKYGAINIHSTTL